MTGIIQRFEGKYRFLSNFYPAVIPTGRRNYPTVEHFYQAMKAFPGVMLSNGKTARQWVAEATTPGKSKWRGNEIPLRPDWENIKTDVMRWGIDRKFEIPELAKKLLATGTDLLVEGNFHEDDFWGIDLATNDGKNMLGKILMDKRIELKNKKLFSKED